MNLIQIIISAVFVNNIILTSYAGVNPAIASSKNNDTAISMGFALTFMMTISTVITKLVNDYVLTAYDLEFLRVLVYVLTIIIVMELTYAIFSKLMPRQFESLNTFKPLLMINNLFLGVALIATNSNFNLTETIFHSIGAGLGFMVVSILLASINYKYRFVDMPRHFKERPLTIMALGLITLAFYGFAGLV